MTVRVAYGEWRTEEVETTPTPTDLLSDWEAKPWVLVFLLVAAGLYAVGMWRVRRRHRVRPWSLGWAAAFYGGLATVAVATMSSIGRYGTTFFWIHMIQHLLLIMVAPTLLVLGRPLVLALHATRNPWHRRIRRVLRSRIVTVVTSPLFAAPAYAAVVVGTHLTGLNNVVITNRVAEAIELSTYLVVGYLYLLSGFGDEPIRWRLSAPAKIVILLLSMPIDTFTGIALLMTDTPRWPAYADVYPGWGPDQVTDVHWGGAMMWVGGDTLMIVLILAAMVPWVRGRGRTRMRWIEKARRAALASYLPAGSTRAIDDDDAALDAYNAWLAKMSDEDRR
jgi:cytochrome c oxidase assembly factor CtaG